MKFSVTLPLFVFMGVFCFCAYCAAAQLGIVSEFPNPPQQQASWNETTNSISPSFVSATRTLFEQGLADPRGCDYREIEIQVGDVWSGTEEKVKTHGWIFSSSSNLNRPFAVCWSGLVYPVISVGERADLQADLESLLGTKRPNMSLALYGRAFKEKMSVAYDSMLPVKVCLLLRLGENDLAARLWSACNADPDNVRNSRASDDPYLTLAGDWAWSIFDRAICAHMRGEVPLALVSVRELTKIQTLVETEASRRKFPHPGYNDSAKHEKERSYLPFLGQLPQLLADLERRAKEPERKSILEIGLTNLPSQAGRITGLIGDLDLVSARQMSQPGGVALFSDPIVAALIHEGDASVEPLLDCFANDKRLTRSVSFGRDFFRDRRIVPVSIAAKSALQQILRVQFQSPAEARAYWKQNKGLKIEDRWYTTLKDDKARFGQWMQAALDIMQPNDVNGVPGSGYYYPSPLKTGGKPELRGEILRVKKNPSITELLLKRAIETAEQANKQEQAMGVQAIQNGAQLVDILSRWDKPATAVVPAQMLMRHAIDLWPKWTTFIMSSGHELARVIPQLTEILVSGGNTNALTEYCVWIKSADQEKIDLYPIEAFEPLCRHPEDPAASGTSEWLFNDAASPWSKLPWQRSAFHDPLDSDLVKLPAFRKLLTRELEKQNLVGSMEWHTTNGGTISYNETRSSGGYQFTWPEPQSPVDGSKTQVRRCDWVAWSLSKSKQIPFFNPFSPIETRDKAIEKAKEALVKSN